MGTIQVPTLYVWGDADATVGMTAAQSTADFVSAPFRFVVLEGVGHFSTDEQPQRISTLLLEQLALYPV
jgi:pimeloyl-ACP methyl ester carboxylesterase